MSLHLEAQLAVRNLDIALDLPDGETLALIGPNGSGKSSILNVLAGLLRPETGRAVLNKRSLFSLGHPRQPTSWLAPHERNIALLAQEPLLFPHLKVLDNVAFSPRCRGKSAAESREVALTWLAEVDAADLSDRKPKQLSGGEAQRVALARALASEPDLVLLDEPLSAIDVDVAPVMRQTLRRVLADRTSIIVTHEILDAVLLADRIAVIDGGRIVEVGATQKILQQPRSAFAASLCGLNLLHGRALDTHSVQTAAGDVVFGKSEVPLVTGMNTMAVFRPSAVSVHQQHPTGSPRNLFTGPITAMEPQAHLIRIRSGGLSADITPASVAQLDLAIGATVHFAVKAAEVSLYPA